MLFRGKGGPKKLNSDKKEVKVQRCASGRHVLVKAVVSTQQQYNPEGSEDNGRPQCRSNRPTGTIKQSSKSKQNILDKSATLYKKPLAPPSPEKTSRTFASIEAVKQSTNSCVNKTNQSSAANNEKTSHILVSKQAPKFVIGNVDTNSISSQQHLEVHDYKSKKSGQQGQKISKKFQQPNNI